VYFWGQVWKTARLYRKPERNRGGTRQGVGHPWDARTTHWEKSLRFLGMPELYSEVHIATNYYLWASLQAFAQESVRPIERRLPSGIRKDQAMPYESSGACATRAQKTLHSIHDCVGWVDGMYAKATWRVWEERKGRLLLKQEVLDLWDELLFAWKDMLWLGVGSPSSKSVHAELHHLVGSTVRVRHCLCHSKANKGKRLGRLPSSIAHQWLPTYASRIPRWVHYDLVWRWGGQ